MKNETDKTHTKSHSTKILDLLGSHPHWPFVYEVCQALNGSGWVAWLAGGCVRDALLGRTPVDFDVATNARPHEIEAVFSAKHKTLNIGKQFGVIAVVFPNCQIEVATFRKDGPYHDGRHPDKIEFSEPYEDAARRDFTVNALFFDVASTQLIDFFGGYDDLKAQIIRTVGEARLRFSEDKLRMLRGARLSAQLGFQIEHFTFQAICDLHQDLHVVSRERIHKEFTNLLIAKHRVLGLEILRSSHLLESFFPELAAGLYYQCPPLRAESPLRPDLWVKAKMRLALAEPPLKTELMMSLLCWDLIDLNWLSIDQLKEILIRLRFSNFKIEKIVLIMTHLPYFLNASQYPKSVLLPLIVTNDFDDVFNIARTVLQVERQSHDGLKYLLELKSLLPHGKLPDPFIKAQHLLDHGVPAGPPIGKILKEAYSLQLDSKIRTHEQAQQWLQDALKRIDHF